MLLTRRHFCAGVAALAAVRPALAADDGSAAGLWSQLMEGNRRFMAGKLRVRSLPTTRQKLVQGQQPNVIVLGCSDSRVSPTLVFDQGLGDLFVIRTAGNVADAVALGSIEYAVEHLPTRLLVVLGHDRCGAVSAAAAGGPMHSPNLDAIVRRIAPAVERAQARAPGDDLVATAVEENARESADNLSGQSDIIRKAVTTGSLVVVPAVYRLATGQVVRVR
jgi:carbonic anhydrase